MVEREEPSVEAPVMDAPAAAADIDEARREVLKRLGVCGAYAAPALVAMLASEKAAAQTGPGIPGGGGTGAGGFIIF